MLDCFGVYTSVRDANNQIIGFHPDYLNEAACHSMLCDWQTQSESVADSHHIFNSQKDLFALCCQVVETGKAIATEYSWQFSSQHQVKITSSLHNRGYSDQFSLVNTSKSLELKINKLEDGFVVIWRDITEQIQTKQALQQSEAQYRALVTQAPVGIFQTDCQGDCLYVNPRWLEITGLSETEAMDKGWSNALHPEDKARVYREWYEAAATKQEFASEYRFRTPSGKVTWVSGTAVGFYNDHQELIGYFGKHQFLNSY